MFEPLYMKDGLNWKKEFFALQKIEKLNHPK